MNIWKLVASCVSTCGVVLALGCGAARADVILNQDTEWTDGRVLEGTIDLAGHKLTVSSLTGNATITSSSGTSYEILEYLDNDGKAYVNTGVTVANDTVIDIKVQLLKDPKTTGYGAAGGFSAYVGARDENSRGGQLGGWIYHNANGIYHYKAVTESEGTLTTFPAKLNTDYLVHLDKAGSCTIDEVEFATGNGIGSEVPITVFCMNQKGGVNFIGGYRVYSCRIAYGNAVQRDLKPARRLSDQALGLLDVKDAANPVFYPNANSTGAFTAGPVVSDEFVKPPAELHVIVADGQTENSSVAITGPVRVVKEGAGTFVATKRDQTYTVGTDILAGTFRCGGAGDHYVYGAVGSEVTVREGATFDCDGWSGHHGHKFVLDGGTITSETDRDRSGYSWFADVTLTKDSFMSGQKYGFVGANWAEGILRMNGHTLTVDVVVAKSFFAGNLKVEGGGEICLRSGGSFALGGNPKGGKYVRAETTTLRMVGAALYDTGGEHVFGSYVSEYAGGWDITTANATIKVKNRFVPGREWHATELQDGATLDLSACEGTWNVTCDLQNSTYATATATFAAGATINLDLGARMPVNGMKLVGWTSADTPLSTVNFKLPDTISSNDFMLERRADGLYVTAAVKSATWTGAAGTDYANPTNWICYDVNDNVIDDALPGSITAVTLSGEVQLDIPANSTFACASFTCDNVSLKGDCDWSGLGLPLNAPIDLAGHKLTVSLLTGNTTITSSADGGYEILEYIDNDGKAYVNTGANVANDAVIDIKVRLLKDPKTSGYGRVGFSSYVGARDADSLDGQFGGWIYHNNTYGICHYKAVTKSEGTLTAFPAAVNADYQVHLDKAGSCMIDGVYFATGNGIGNDVPITVFCMNQKQKGVTAVDFIGGYRVYSCRIVCGGAVQRDLKPARRLSDGALGLLDVKNTANLVFYPNANTTGAFTAGPVVSDAFAKPPAELHVVVADGLTTENTTVAITGPVRVVKEGAGTFVATKSDQTYAGGTDVAAGTFRCGYPGDKYVYGAAGGEVTVREGATFDCDGWSGHHGHRFVLDGGTIKCATDRGRKGYSWFADVTLTKDSFMSGRKYGFVGANWADGVLRMNGHTLTVDVMANEQIYAGNLKVEGGGEIYAKTGGYFVLGGNPDGGKYVSAETTTLRMGGAALYDAGGEHVFGAYVSEYSGGWDQPNTVIKVQNRFVPGTQWHATELQDGATLDLSVCEGTWDVTCEFKNKKTTATATFAEGATINVDFGDRKIGVGEKVIGWTSDTAPAAGVKFISKQGKLRRTSDGAYYMRPFVIYVR